MFDARFQQIAIFLHENGWNIGANLHENGTNIGASLHENDRKVCLGLHVNGRKAIQLLCYYGSSTYNTKEFSVLLDGVIEHMKDLGLQPPIPRDIRSALEEWEKQHGNQNDRQEQSR